MIQQFAARYIEGKRDPNGQYSSYCKYLQFFWSGQRGRINGAWAWDVVASAYPSSTANGYCSHSCFFCIGMWRMLMCELRQCGDG
jgi:hypothetical protein